MKNGRALFVVAAATVAFSMSAAVRPLAVPLVSVEPHFSVWSAADRLYDADTAHWLGAKLPLSILLAVSSVACSCLCPQRGIREDRKTALVSSALASVLVLAQMWYNLRPKGGDGIFRTLEMVDLME